MAPDSSQWDWRGLAPVYGRMRSQNNPGWKGLWEVIEIGISRLAADLLLLERKMSVKNVSSSPMLSLHFEKW